MRYDLTSLKLFVAVAECGNLTRAAEREHLAVSAISKRIAELEDIVRTPLLQRQPRGVTLTPAGQSLLHYARQMLQLVQRMDAELGEYATGVKGHVRLHAVASALTQFLPEELESFLARYPLVNVALEEHTGKAVVLAVASGAAEIGVIASRTPAAGLATFPYHADRLVMGVPVGHALAKRKSLTFAEAAQHPFVGPHAESSLASLLADAARDADVTLQQRVQASSFDAMCRLVETRLGITMLPEGVLAPHAAAGRLVVVPLKENWAVRQTQLIVRDADQLSPIARTLLDHLRQSATDAAR
ncbi:MAG: LysR substrate-binding domain-containing protein [Piscinibacter sp.]